jgi:paired amphipathic helix protein Sin3a
MSAVLSLFLNISFLCRHDHLYFEFFKPSVIDMSSVSSPDSRRKFPYGTDGLLPSQAPNQQDSFVYNAGVERQFFDLVKEALTSSYSRNGETAWIEFRKCLDTYTQEIISRSEMLSIMEDLLGKKHVELFEEFKCILSAAGSSTTYGQEDSWHSVPLSEIEFNRCRRCTPSYRALPRDYPNPPCSDRHDEDATVLNDTWVSLPVGSEENTRFRHMRKNQYEEVLFRCEDERFEIDMVIDSNCSTLHRLEPIAEEILFLQQQFRASKEQGTVAENMVFRYYFDPSILSTIHKNCIIRIYGDAGPEMLDLLLKNPAVVVPIIVKRLRQKDKEFREAKEILNRRWKDLAEANYFRSVDHRNLTWRAADKRATSTRTLLTDIKDRAANNGSESEGCSLSRRDKAKEEHGAFYDVTMGRYLGRKMDLITLPKPSKSVFTPHYYICYDNASWAQQDACRILLYMVERGSTSPVDKERCYKLWRDLFGPFFGLSMMWMHSPTALNSSNDIGLTTVVKHDNADEIDDDNDSIEDDGIIGNLKVKEEVMRHGHTAIDKNESSILEHQPIPVGAHLSTLYGEGILVEYRRLERIYVVELAFGAKAFLRPNAVLCSVLHPERSSITEKLRAEDKECLVSSDDRLCFGPQSLYLFFRLHHILVQRLIVARNLAYTVDDDPSLRTIIEKLPVSKCLDRGKQRYGAYLSLLYSLADGGQSAGLQQLSTSSSEGVKYEDRVRSMLGHGAFELTTVDKLLTHILKNLQILANDEVFQSMIQVFRRHLLSKKFKPNAFRQEVAMLSEGEPIYAFQHCTIPKSDRAVVYMELLGSLSDVDDNEKNPLQTQDMAKRSKCFHSS